MDIATIRRWYESLESGRVHAVCGTSGREVTSSSVGGVAPLPTDVRRLIFPGAFNPLHDGHRGMADLAEQRVGAPVEFEISLENVDKSSLDEEGIRVRLQQFTPDQRVWLTRAMRFSRKAELFRNVTFVVGADTIARVADLKYYEHDERLRREAIAQIADCGARFLVFGRNCDGRFNVLDALILPDELKDLCEGVRASEFRADISSSEIRIARDE